jgi:hypothetical protein
MIHFLRGGSFRRAAIGPRRAEFSNRRTLIGNHNMATGIRRVTGIRSAAIGISAAFALIFSAISTARADSFPSLLYNWDFNGPATDPTVTPSVGQGGVLTMSQQFVDEDNYLGPPAATNLYSAAGTGVFGATNPNDRAFNNIPTRYNIDRYLDEGDVAGIVSSDNPPITPAANNTLVDPAGMHAKITITGWVQLDNGVLPSPQTENPQPQPRFVMVGPQNFDLGTPGTGGTYFGFSNTTGHTNTLQFKINGAGGVDGITGAIGTNDILGNNANGWMFVAVTYDSTIPVSFDSNHVATSAPNVNFYIGNQIDHLGTAASSTVYPVSGNTGSNLATPGAAAFDGKSVYIGNKNTTSAQSPTPMNVGLDALIDDVRLYDGVLDQFQLDRVRQNLPLPPRGDFNLDGVVNSADIDAMQIALCDLPDFQANNHMSNEDLLALGDYDSSQAISNADFQGLLYQLSQSGNPASALNSVPEPAAAPLILLGMVGFFYQIRSFRAAKNRRQSFSEENLKTAKIAGKNSVLSPLSASRLAISKATANAGLTSQANFFEFFVPAATKYLH